jgi:GAF domain
VKEPTFFASGQSILPHHEGLSRAIATYVELAVKSSGASGGSFYVRDVTKDVLVPYATIGIPSAFTRLCGAVRVGDQCCGRAVLHKKPWVVEDMLTDPLFASGRSAVANSTVRAGFSVPVLAGSGDSIGALACVFNVPHTPTSADILRIESWADLISRSIADALRSCATSVVLPVLSGWKDIANYLGRGVRTVQRYEQELGLPIRRNTGKLKGSVVASQSELDSWVTSSPLTEHSQFPDASVVSLYASLKGRMSEMQEIANRTKDLISEIRALQEGLRNTGELNPKHNDHRRTNSVRFLGKRVR